MPRTTAKKRPRNTAVEIKPAIMKWVVESSGWKTKDLAGRLEVAESEIRDWMKTGAEISIPKLEEVSDCLKRPLAVFFLPKPPEKHDIPDYRMLPDASATSPKTAIVIREAQSVQYRAGRMMAEQNLDTEPKIGKTAKLRTPPEAVARKERARLGLDSPDMSGGNLGDFYEKLRDTIESANILVLQYSMDLGEMRGFALSGRRPCVIVTNSRDSHHARVFTLLHEYGHVLLNKGGMCIPSNDIKSNAAQSGSRVEPWCNRFAASVLMPREEFLDELSRLEERASDAEQIVSKMSKKFKASSQAVAIRIADLTKNASYQKYALRPNGVGVGTDVRRSVAPDIRCVSRLFWRS